MARLLLTAALLHAAAAAPQQHLRANDGAAVDMQAFPDCPADTTSGWTADQATAWKRLAEDILGSTALSGTTTSPFYSGRFPVCPPKIGFEVKWASSATKDADVREVYFVTHGLAGKPTNTWLVTMANKLAAMSGVRAASCSWKNGAKSMVGSAYGQAATNTFSNGFMLAQEMQAIRDKFPTAKITCIGHSYGAHSCGHAGKILFQGVTAAAAAASTKTKLQKIIALDPAGPPFHRVLGVAGKLANWRLGPDDATFVYGMHTNSGNWENVAGRITLGTFAPVGHLDVYPNYGNHQPACAGIKKTISSGVNTLSRCDHSAATWYLIDSMDPTKASDYTATQDKAKVCPGKFSTMTFGYGYKYMTHFGDLSGTQSCNVIPISPPLKWGYDAVPVADVAGVDCGSAFPHKHIRTISNPPTAPEPAKLASDPSDAEDATEGTEDIGEHAEVEAKENTVADLNV